MVSSDQRGQMGSLFGWRGWSVFLFFPFPVLADTSFIAAELHNMGAEALRDALSQTAASSRPAELEQAMHWLALGTLESESEHPHAAQNAYLRVEDFCVGWRASRFEGFDPKLAARASAVCALAGAERTAQGYPWMHWHSSKRLRSDVQAVLLGDADDAERLHVMGRLRSSLSPAFGLDFRAALMSWRVLERSYPTAAGTDYWLARTFERQGNYTSAAEAMDRALALSTPDPRAVARAAHPANSDALDFGWAPAFFNSPARGIGLGIRAWDDRIADRRQSISGGIHASTRGNLWVAAEFTEGHWVDPLRVQLSFAASDRLRDYFGVGISTPFSPAQVFRSNQTQSEVRVSGRWSKLEFGGGALVKTFSADTPPAGAVGQGLTGMVAQFSWDSRDRTAAPRSGSLFLIRQEWLWTADGVLVTRSRWEAATHFRLAMRHTLDWNLTALATGGSVPYNVLPDLFDTGAPAVREFRWLDGQAAATWLNYHYLLLPWLRLGGFAVAGAVAPEIGGLPAAARFGLGVQVQFLVERMPRFAPMWNFGMFNREFLIQGGIRAEL